MIFAGFSLAKLLGGLAFWRGDKLGKLIYQLFIIAVCLGVFWKLFLAPTHKTTQRANTIQNITNQSEKDFAFVGIKMWLVKLGISIEQPEDKTNTVVK